MSLRRLLPAFAFLSAAALSSGQTTLDLVDLGNTLAVRAKVGGSEALLLLDTGSYELRLQKSFAEKLPLRLRPVGKDALGVVSLSIGDLVDPAAKLLVQSTPLPFEDDSAKREVVGIVGLGFLQRHAVGIDLVQHRLTLWEGGKLDDRKIAAWYADAKWQSTPLKGSEQQSAWYRVRTEIDGKGLDLVLDTGSSWTIIAPRHARSMKLPRLGAVASFTFDGRQKVDACLAPTVRFGPITLENQVVAIDSSDDEYDGLLGLQSLRGCKILLDFPAQKAVFARASGFVASKSDSPLAGVGIDLMRLSDDRLMAIVGSGSPAERAGVRSGDILISFNGRPAEELVALTDGINKTPTTAAWTEAMLRKTYSLVMRRPDGTVRKLSIKRA